MRQRLLSVLTFVAVCLSGSASHAIEFAAHRALYELTLAQAQEGSGISEVTGELAVEWRNGCSGWTFEYRSIIDVLFSGRDPLRLSSTASTWESSDGRHYRFSVRHRANGENTESIEGVATAAGSEKTGQVVFSKPKRRRMKLPAGTLFPIAHSLAIMEVAAKGKAPAFLSRMVFDGMDATGLYQVNAAIGRGYDKGSDRAPLKNVLKDTRSWPVDLAYFSFSDNKPEPDHEIKMRLYANGVADDMILDFDDFAMKAQIGRLELLKEPGCR